MGAESDSRKRRRQEAAVLATPQRDGGPGRNPSSAGSGALSTIMSPEFIEQARANDKVIQDTAGNPKNLGDERDLVLFTVPDNMDLNGLHGDQITLPIDDRIRGTLGTQLQVDEIKADIDDGLHMVGFAAGKPVVAQIAAVYAMQAALDTVPVDEEPVDMEALNALWTGAKIAKDCTLPSSLR
jgi:hypothetical protein